MILRVCKTVLVFAVALYTTFIVFNNLVDYGSNYDMVRHVMTMDTIPANSGTTWRAIFSLEWHVAFYWVIIVWETVSTAVCWWGGVRLAKAWKQDAREFRGAKNIAIAGLMLNLLIWLVGFLTIGGEWFLMWQSKIWNGQEAAFRMFTVVGVVLLFLTQPENGEAST